MKRIIHNNADLAYCVDFMMSIEITKPMRFECSVIRGKRSLNQNSLLWLWCTALEKDSETGYTKDEFYQYFLDKFAPRKEIFTNLVIVTTSQMDSKQMSDFLDSIQRLAITELQFKLPDPEDIIFSTFYETYKHLI